MIAITCPICRSQFEAHENPIIRSTKCGHGVCIACILSKYPTATYSGQSIKWHSSTQSIECLVCKVKCNTNEMVSWSNEHVVFDKASVARRRVMTVMHCDRECFPNTPSYDAFLENREDLIYTFTHSRDPKELSQAEELLVENSIQFQNSVLETEERAKQKKVNNILEIVNIEGNFYELAKMSYGIGFNLPDREILHPLYVEFNSYFLEPNKKFLSNQSSNVVEAGPKGDMLLKSLYNSLPNTLNIERKTYPIAARRLASGFNRNLVLQRAQQEAYAYFLN